MASRDYGPQADPASFAYSLFKVLSILMVVSGHWFAQSPLPLWIPTVVGLFIFAFSSGMFTARIYGVDLDVRAFWRKKLQRLLVPYWLALFCLALLLLARGEPVLHWHSLVHVFGLSGFLNIFGHNDSALGAGLWFFTLLLAFYLSYPYLARVFAATGHNLWLPLAMTALMAFLDARIHLGFSLWLTALGFIVGVFAGGCELWVPCGLSLSLAVAGTALMLALNAVFNFKGANSALLALVCISTNLWLMRVRIPQWRPLRWLARLENCLLEIFLVHIYLFVHPTGRNGLDFLLSLVLIVAASWSLNLAAAALMGCLFAPRKPAGAPLFNDPALMEIGLQEGMKH
jgi:peptidoglycan/LPS O-acetylase OafA/YrhL